MQACLLIVETNWFDVERLGVAGLDKPLKVKVRACLRIKDTIVSEVDRPTSGVDALVEWSVVKSVMWYAIRDDAVRVQVEGGRRGMYNRIDTGQWCFRFKRKGSGKSKEDKATRVV